MPILLMIILAAITLRSAALLVDFNPQNGYFDGKIIITISGIITAIGSLGLFTYAFTSPKEERLIASFSTPETYIPTGAVCTSLSMFIIHGFIEIKEMNTSISYLLSFKNMGESIFATSVILAIFAVAHFILTAMLTDRESNSRAAFGLANVLFLALYTSYLYFDTELPMNAPNKIVDQMAFLFAALFFLYEIRISLKREVWNLYIAFGFIAATLTAYSSIPSLIFYFTNKTPISNSIYENILCFCLFIFILSRLILASKLKEDKESEVVVLIKNYSAERDIISEKIGEDALAAYEELFGNEYDEESADTEYATLPKAEEEDLIEIASAEENEEKIEKENFAVNNDILKEETMQDQKSDPISEKDI